MSNSQSSFSVIASLSASLSLGALLTLSASLLTVDACLPSTLLSVGALFAVDDLFFGLLWLRSPSLSMLQSAFSSLQLQLGGEEMAVGNQMGHLVDQDRGAIDHFPVGMRVLAVDDDPVCLKVIETLLRKCKYHVTTTNQAIEALRLLNRNKFDLVITDLNMPGMDGFMLLELVGLQMDLPVIMLSAHSDTKLVMRGVNHGACDYLLKPVRIEELSNIWQHVLRRKKSDSKDQNKGSNKEKGTNTSGGGSQNNSADQNKKPRKKRKDQDEEEEEEFEVNGDDDDPSTLKKARVHWSDELHRKFVAAVNQLGLDKAVPKKILNLMNVEGLTRENVASHLQKYRLSLKK